MRSLASFSVIALVTLICLASGCASGSQPAPAAQAPVEQKTIDRAATLIAQQLVAGLSQSTKPKTAVLDLTDTQGNVTELGRLLQEEIAGKLTLTGQVGVVERLKLNEVLGELALQQTGVVNEATAKRLGQQSGAEAVVFGSVADLNSIIKLNVRLVDVEKGNVLAWGSAEITKDSAVSRLMAQMLVTGGRGSRSAQPNPPSPSASKVYENESYRLTVVSLRKSGNIATADLVVENLLDRELYLSLSPSPLATYLADDVGARWGYHTDTVFLFGSTKISPKGKRRTTVTFGTQESQQGRVFTLRVQEGAPQIGRVVIIKDIMTQN